MAVLSFRHAAMLSPSGYHLLDRLLAIPYNTALDERIHARRMSGRSISLHDRFPSLTAIRRRDLEWQRISVLVARSALVRLDRAMQGFPSRVKSGREPGFPRFRARSPYRSFIVGVPKAARTALRIRDAGRRWGELRRKDLPRIRFAIRRPLPRPDRIWGFRVLRKARRVEIQLPVEQVLSADRTGAPERPLGLDAGTRSHATLSDGGGGERQRKPAKRVEERQKQRAPSQKWRGSKSRGTKEAAPARARQRVAENGRQPIHRHTDQVVKCRGFRAVELLQIRNTIRRRENKRGLKRAVAEEGTVDVPRSWPLKPSGLSVGDEFRLMFVTSTRRNASSTNIEDYNAFVQRRAAVGHAAIRPTSISSKFKVVGSTGTIDARNNTATTYTNDEPGVQIWWLNGGKLGDDYRDFYDGSWDSRQSNAGRNEGGAQFPPWQWIWTGTDDDGTATANPLGATSTVTHFRMLNFTGTLNNTGTNPKSELQSLLGLSPVFRVTESVRGYTDSISSSPADRARGYNAGETIRLRVDFGEPVGVTGAPYLVLDVGGTARRAVYESGSGTRYLEFAYRVARDEIDTNGVSLCSDTTKDAGCGKITLNGGSIVVESDSKVVERDLLPFGDQRGHKVDGVAGVKGVSITSTPADRARGYNAGETIRLRVDFREPVRVPGAPYLVLDVGGTARRAVYKTGTGTRYLEFTYPVARDDTDTNGISLCADARKDAGCGQITLSGGSIVAVSDSKGVVLGLHSLGDQPGHKVDGVVEAKGVSITSAPADRARGYNAGETIRLRMDFGEPVSVTGAPYLALSVGGTVRRAAYESGSGTRYLVFAYPVARDDTDTNGISICADTRKDAGCGQIALNGGSIVAESDSATVEQLDLPELGSQYGHKVDAILSARSVAITSTPVDAAEGYAAREAITVRVTVAEAVTVTGSPYLVLDVGGVARRAFYASGSGTGDLEFVYVVARGDVDVDGVSLCSDTELDTDCGQIALGGGSIRAVYDLADAELDLPALGDQSGHKVDGKERPPDVAIGSTPADAAAGYAAGETIRVRVDFPENLSVRGSPYLVLDIAGVLRRAVYESGDGSRQLVFAYTVSAEDFDSNGVSLCSDRALDPGCGRITLAGGSIRAVFDDAPIELVLPEVGDQPGHKVDGDPDFVDDPSHAVMPNSTTGVVPEGWALIPSGIGPGASFRLLFVSSTHRNASSSDINDYNDHVIAAAGSGHSAIRALRDGFRVVASTTAVDARDNTATTYTAANKGVPIHWLNGDRVADDYEDFYDGSWDNRSGKGKNEAGAGFSNTAWIWTGSRDNGTEGGALGNSAGSTPVQLRGSTTLGSNSLFTVTLSLHLFGLSQVLQVQERPEFASLAVVSTPRDGEAYRVGETLAIEWTFTQPVTVRGAPKLEVRFGSAASTAEKRLLRYVSGSGTDTLRFEYVVQGGDYASGATPFFVVAAAGQSPITLDGATIRARAQNFDANLVPDASATFESELGDGQAIDARPVVVENMSISTSARGISRAGDTITVELEMRRAVRVTGSPYVALDVGGAKRRATYAGPIATPTSTLEFRYVVAMGDFDGNGVSSCASGADCGSIQLNGGSIRAPADAPGVELELPPSLVASRRVDGTPAMPHDTSCSAEIRVPPDWSLVPSGVNAGERFRLLFITTSARDATSKNIADYNANVQLHANSHSATRGYSGGFRALASTGAANARANTCTRSSDDDAVVYWLGTNTKVADDYADLYDGSWDNLSGATNTAGGQLGLGTKTVWTGTTNTGSTSSTAPLGGTASNARTLWADPKNNVEAVTTPKPFHNGDSPNTEERLLYGLSQVFVAPARPTGNAISILSAPALGDTYLRGETIEFEVTFTEAVAVLGTPQINLVMREAVEGGEDRIASEFVAS